jgi:DNA repair ATPase RecN
MERPQKLKQDLLSAILGLKKNVNSARLPNENTIKKMMDSLKGCPENENPETVVILYQKDFEQVLKMVETLENEKKSIKDQLDGYESSIKNLQDDKVHLK